MKENKWKSIWNNRTISEYNFDPKDPEQVFMELKNAMGVVKLNNGEEIKYQDYKKQFMGNFKEMTFSTDDSITTDSFFEV